MFDTDTGLIVQNSKDPRGQRAAGKALLSFCNQSLQTETFSNKRIPTNTTLVCSLFSLCLPRRFWCKLESRLSSLLLDFHNHLTLGLFHSKWLGQSPNPAAGHHSPSAWLYTMDIVHTGSTCSSKSTKWKKNKNVLPLEFLWLKGNGEQSYQRQLPEWYQHQLTVPSALTNNTV